MKSLNNKKLLGSIILGTFLFTGLYNAIVMNSASDISSNNSILKRLDEMYGVTTESRSVASTVVWNKITKSQLSVVAVQAPVATAKIVAASAPVQSEAAIQEDLTLGLIEVINPTKWAKGLSSTQFNGSLTANNGVIESLNVTLPGAQGFTANFTEMSGNVFNYEMNGQQLSGMMYQVDANSFMVTLTNGPLAGTRFRFGGEATLESQEKIEQTLAENHNVEIGTFGDVQAPVIEDNAPMADVKTAGFNFKQTSI